MAATAHSMPAYLGGRSQRVEYPHSRQAAESQSAIAASRAWMATSPWPRGGVCAALASRRSSSVAVTGRPQLGHWPWTSAAIHAGPRRPTDANKRGQWRARAGRCEFRPRTSFQRSPRMRQRGARRSRRSTSGGENCSGNAWPRTMTSGAISPASKALIATSTRLIKFTRPKDSNAAHSSQNSGRSISPKNRIAISDMLGFSVFSSRFTV